jgi:L-aspartate oxidase
MEKSDFLVIGTGVAGLSLALKVARFGSVNLITKKDPADSNTSLAQGGIASVIDSNDDFALHVKDTLEAGAGLCKRAIVEMVVREGPARIKELMDLGVSFSRAGDSLSLGREGGHSRNRIVHCQDLTGREVERILLERVTEHPRIRLFPHHMAVNLILKRHLKDPAGASERTVYGCYVLDVRNDRIIPFTAGKVVLATGGAGKVYIYTSNPDIATGDGIALAYRAGARVANLEFVQFHPTCLFHPEAKSFLLSEALRGEGGILRREDGHAFMRDYHPMKDLAPRDVVARAIDKEMKQTGTKCVYLDMTHLDSNHLKDRFPNIFRRCMELGIDMTTQPIPVVPATHYFCGGVDVDENGSTTLGNLFALGEVSHTGLHGANRLASNSLLEALVFAERAAKLMEGTGRAAAESTREPKPWEESHAEKLMDSVIIDHDWDMARRVMWDYVGIVRSDLRLHLALERIGLLRETIENLYWKYRLTQDLIELRNIVLVGELIIRCALMRKESRGLHATETYPERNDKIFGKDTVLEIGDD